MWSLLKRISRKVRSARRRKPALTENQTNLEQNRSEERPVVSNNMDTLKKIKDVVQDCNINFLLGSGLSAPYLRTLGNMELLLTALDALKLDEAASTLIRCSLYKKYFESVIVKNLKILENDDEAVGILSEYRSFLSTVNSILLRRKSTILPKEANLFTTNLDIFLERALEDARLEYNDGFNGRFQPIFSLSNFKKSRSKRSLHYDNVSELPVFNLLKIHGSLCWKLDVENSILFSGDLAQTSRIRDAIPPNGLVDVADGITIEQLQALAVEIPLPDSAAAFLEEYEKLLIVNPTKEKFKQSLLNETYYEILRMYSNELERENTVLFVMGFSFADEHIRALTIRAANSNPTLMIYVFAHTSTARAEIEQRLDLNNLTNRNIEILAPTQKDGADEFQYTLSTITSDVFDRAFGN